jgi:hypothetical protein
MPFSGAPTMAEPKKRKKLKKPKERKVLPEAAERRALYVSYDEVVLIEYLLTLYDQGNKLLGPLDQLISEFQDGVRRLHEIEAREKANAYWEEPQEWIDKQIRQAQKVRRAQMEKRIAHLKAKEMRRILRRQEKEKAREEARKRKAQALQAAVDVAYPADETSGTEAGGVPNLEGLGTPDVLVGDATALLPSPTAQPSPEVQSPPEAGGASLGEGPEA